MKSVSIIVVNYKSTRLLSKLKAGVELKKTWEWVEVDNSKKNRGFGNGCNLGAKRARGRVLFFLNPDTQVTCSAVELLEKKLLGDESIGIVGPQLVDEKAIPYLSFTRLPTRKSAWWVYSFLNRLWSTNQHSKQYWYQGKRLDKSRDVGSLSGAALMIRKKDFEKLGGFEGKLFMYWEDADLCWRMQKDLGKRVRVETSAIVVHTRGGSTDERSSKTRRWFQESRYVYLKKHFGWGYATAVQSFLLLTEEWRLMVIMGLALYLRFDHLTEWMPLIGDQGRDMLAAAEGLVSHKLPLLGIPSSVPRFRQGPLFIWGLMLLFGIFGLDPVVAGMAAAALGSLVVGLVYLLADRWWNRTAAVVAGLVTAASPLAVSQSRLAFHTNPIPLASWGLLWMLTRKLKTIKHWWWLGLMFGLLFQFELAVFPLIILVGWKIWMTRKEAGLKVRMKGLAVLGGIITGLIPQVIYDLTHQFSQLGLFLVWVGYRIVGFMGWNEHRLSGEGMVSWWQRVSEYGVKFLAPGVPLLAGFMGVLMVLGMVVMGVRKKKNWSHENWLVMWLVVMMLGFVVHSGPSEAYFPVLFVPVGLFVGYLVKELRPGWQKMGMILILGLVMVNVEYLKRLDYLMNTSHAKENGLVVGYGPTLEVQNRIVSWLVEKADGRNIILESRGPGAEFESYLDNYRFLLKSRGYSPIANESVWFIFLFGDEKRLNFLNGVTYEIEGMRLVFLEE